MDFIELRSPDSGHLYCAQIHIRDPDQARLELVPKCSYVVVASKRSLKFRFEPAGLVFG